MDKDKLYDYVSVPEVVESKIMEEVEKEVGEVTGCRKLNVRVRPSKNAPVETVITKGTILMVDVNKSTEEFYKVYNQDGIEGFCMKKFIELQS